MSTPTEPAEARGTHYTQRWYALAVIAVAQLMVVLDATIVNIALPSVQEALGFSDDSRQWIVTAYALSFGGLLLLGGRLSDFLGRKRIFMVGLAGFALASALGGIASNVELLIAARALQGLFGALLAPASLSLLMVLFTDPVERAKAFGVYGAIAGGGSAIGLLMGGVLTEYASWRWCLLVNIPIAAIALFFGPRLLDESKAHENTQLDIPGAITATAGLVLLVFGFAKAETDGWGAAVTIGSLIASIGLLIVFVVVERATKHPLLPMRVILDRNRGGSFLASTLVGAGLFAMFFFLTYYLQLVHGYSAIRSGIAFLPFSAGVITSAGMASKVLPKVGPRIPMVGGLILALLGMLVLTTLEVHSSYVGRILPAFLLLSIGMGFVFVPLSSTALVGVGNHDAGVASAMINTTQQIGGALGTALLSTIAARAATNYASSHTDIASNPEFGNMVQTHGFTVAFAVGALFIAIAAIASFVLVQASKDEIDTEAMVHAG